MSSIETSVRRWGSSVQGPRVAQLRRRRRAGPGARRARGRGWRPRRTRCATGRSARSGRRARRSPGCSRRGPPGGPGPAPRTEPVGRRRERGVGRDEDLGVARARRERRGQAQRVAEVADVGRSARSPAIACRTRPRSDVPFATTRAVRPAAITLTLPPAGRSLSASTAAALAASSRFGVTSVACIEAEVSTTRTRSPARPGRPLDERARREEHEDQHQQQLEQQQEAAAQPLPRRVRLDVGDELLPQERRRARRPRRAAA